MAESDNKKETFEARLNRETKPPNGQRLNLHSMRFAEVIKISEAENLKNGLARLYKEIIPVKNAMKFTSDEDNYRNFIVRSKKAFYQVVMLTFKVSVQKHTLTCTKKG